MSASCINSLIQPLSMLCRSRLCEVSICEALSSAHAAAPAQLLCPQTSCELSNALLGLFFSSVAA